MSIVVGYIPTPEGETALARAIAEAQLRNDRLLVINSSRGDALVDPRYVQQEEAATLEQRLQASGVEYSLLQQLRGMDAADEVLAAAEEHGADLIVIGLRKRTPVGKMIMGSTSQRVLLQADCAVLAVKAGTA
jgi:nucleotide-binding universal stress UspA family protein